MLDGENGGGVFYSTSPDLLRWSAPAKLFPASGEVDSGAAIRRLSPIHPSWHPKAPGRIFDTIGDSALLFYTRFNVTNCKTSMDRDLMRLPIRVRQGGAAQN